MLRSKTCCCREGEGPPEVRLPGPGKAISDTQMAWNSSTVGQLSPQQQAAQAANCSGGGKCSGWVRCRHRSCLGLPC